MNERMRPWITDEDKAAVAEVLDSGDLMSGKRVQAFEEALASYFGKRHAVCVSSGTAALECAFAATGEGDRLNSARFVAMRSAALAAGKLGIDCAGGVGTDVCGKPTQARSRCIDKAHTFTPETCDAEVNCYSFNANKFIACGGGAILTDNSVVAEYAKQYRNHGRQGRDRFMDGRHLRMGEMNAALGLSQLRRIETILTMRKQVAMWYEEAAGLCAYGDGMLFYAARVLKPYSGRTLEADFNVRGGTRVEFVTALLPNFPLMTRDDVFAEAAVCSL